MGGSVSEEVNSGRGEEGDKDLGSVIITRGGILKFEMVKREEGSKRKEWGKRCRPPYPLGRGNSC